MNRYLEERVRAQLNQFDRAILATCGPAGPQLSHVRFETQGQIVYLFLLYGSDHLFNLETDAQVVLLAPTWKLYGRGTVVSDTASIGERSWQVIVQVAPLQLHILSGDHHSVIETIDL